MTPRELSVAVIHSRLAAMEELLDIARGMGPIPAFRLEAEPVTRLAVERILTQLVELASDINGHIAAAAGALSRTDYRATFDAVARLGVLPEELARELKPSVGLRNVLVHEYVNVELDIVAGAADRAFSRYADYVRTVAACVTSKR